jgi:hypothetical protein
MLGVGIGFCEISEMKENEMPVLILLKVLVVHLMKISAHKMTFTG